MNKELNKFQDFYEHLKYYYIFLSRFTTDFLYQQTKQQQNNKKQTQKKNYPCKCAVARFCIHMKYF